jgi:hypothetical protein
LETEVIGRRLINRVAQRDAGCARDLSGSTPGLCDCELQSQNEAYAGTGGVSQNNKAAGFIPAYRNASTGQTVVSRFADGRPAPVHVLDGLPPDWVAARDESGVACKALATVVAGFMRDGIFYTRDDAARLVADEDGAKSA